MTVEEYDSKKGLTNAIRRIDSAIYSVSIIMGEVKPVYNSALSNAIDISCVIEDPVVAKRFKQLLIERKKELVEEFSK